MILALIEINLESLFNINLIVFTVIAFIFSVFMTILLVIMTRPLNIKIKKLEEEDPEKFTSVYLRLILYILTEFIAFIVDIFLVIFGYNYTRPWCTIVVFLGIVLYKLIFVVFRCFKELGFDYKGIFAAFKTVLKIMNKEDIIDTLEEMIPEENKKKKKKKDKTMTMLIVLLLSFFVCFGSFKVLSSAKSEIDEGISLIQKRIFLESETQNSDTILFKIRGETKFTVVFNE